MHLLMVIKDAAVTRRRTVSADPAALEIISQNFLPPRKQISRSAPAPGHWAQGLAGSSFLEQPE